jgi:hypothetical protein
MEERRTAGPLKKLMEQEKKEVIDSVTVISITPFSEKKRDDYVKVCLAMPKQTWDRLEPLVRDIKRYW